jgi:hypothetical protein
MVVLRQTVEQVQEEAMVWMRLNREFPKRQQDPQGQRPIKEPVRFFHIGRMIGQGYMQMNRE